MNAGKAALATLVADGAAAGCCSAGVVPASGAGAGAAGSDGPVGTATGAGILLVSDSGCAGFGKMLSKACNAPVLLNSGKAAIASGRTAGVFWTVIGAGISPAL